MSVYCLRGFIRFALNTLFAVCFLSVGACSKVHNVSDSSNSENVFAMGEADQLADGNAFSTIFVTFLDRKSARPIYIYLIPLEAFRHISKAYMIDLQDGQYEGKSLHLNLVYAFGEILLPSEANGQLVQSILYITIDSTTDDYRDRMRAKWHGDVQESDVRRRTGVMEYGAERISIVGIFDGEREVYFAEDAEFGPVVISCRGVLQSDGSFVMDHGKCTASFQLKPKLMISVSFHQSLRADWRKISRGTVDAISKWEIE